MISDGLVIRLRVRSFADLDQTTGRAAVWSRQSYYAGVAPSRGLAISRRYNGLPVAYEPGAIATRQDRRCSSGTVTSTFATATSPRAPPRSSSSCTGDNYEGRADRQREFRSDSSDRKSKTGSKRSSITCSSATAAAITSTANRSADGSKVELAKTDPTTRPSGFGRS